MSISSDGVIFFGFSLGNEEDREEALPWEILGDDWDWDDYLAQKMGIVRENYAEFGLYYDARNKAIAELGCEVYIHGGDYCVAHDIALVSTYKSASRGCPVTLSQDHFNVTEEDIAKLKKFCEFLGAEWQEPSWILTSWMG
ncbi:MAG: hypothetical protein DRP01_00070 [Archaeoglobales archaeon]|nr:MAG: hypothetical protein DRP01_00070 [Archaeoglobales archaeon]